MRSRMPSFTAIMIVAVAIATSAAAKEVYVPIAGSVGVFRTDTRVFNPSSEYDIVVSATFLPVGRNNAAATSREITVGKRQMAVFDDVVASLLGQTGLGAVRLSSDHDFVATSRIYAATPEGTLGQFVSAQDISAAKSRGLLVQLKATGGPGQRGTFRTNLGFVNPHEMSTTVTIRMYDRSSAAVGAPMVETVPPFGVLFPLNIDSARADFTDGWIAFEASQPVFGFASVVDNGTTDAIFIPAFEDTGRGAPTVFFDEGHFNFHSIGTTYAPFAQMLRNEGWTVERSAERFERQSLERAGILVIVNALAAVNANVDNWRLPTPSAFTPEEIAAVRDWVEAGGALLLIADHMPFAGAAEELGAAFGIRFSNGFAFDTRQLGQPKTCLAETEVQVFRKSDESLAEHPVTSGVDSVGTFTGSAFQTGSNSVPLLVFGSTAVSLTPSVAWQFTSSTPRVPVAGWQQGALLQHGQGRVAVFGEAAMFTEQTCGPGRPMGMTSPAARQNRTLLLNVMRWLAGRL